MEAKKFLNGYVTRKEGMEVICFEGKRFQKFVTWNQAEKQIKGNIEILSFTGNGKMNGGTKK